ncbi:MAG: hypothetical protein E7556_07365 [Ruminococcaceae bacterium]|nr:hypothetical protein [Oscillospiraceae bacterium]
MKKDKIKKEKAPKVKKEKKVKEKKVQSPEEKVAFEAAVKGFTSSGVFKALVVLFVCSLVFTMFSSSILRLTAIPGALKSRAAAISANINAQNNNNNGNNGNNNIQNVIQQIIQPDTTSISIDVQGTTVAPTTQAPTTTKTPDTTTTTATPETTTSSEESSTTTTTTKPTTTEPLTDSPAMIKEKKAVLNTYKKVVNTANSIKPGFTKVQYRTMEKDDSAKLVLGSVEKNYPGYFISQGDAEAAPIVSAKFSDMSLFLIENGDYACLLSDKNASEAIRRVEKTAQSDGSTKITIVLRNEENPAVTPADQKKPESFTSSMFPVVDKEDIKEKLVARQGMLTTITDVNLLYHDCTLEINYMPKTGKVLSVTQTVQYDCVVTYDLTVPLLGLAIMPGQTATGTVTDTAVYTDFVY